MRAMSLAAEDSEGEQNDLDLMFDRFHREVSEGDFPEVHAHVRYHLEREAPHDEFGFVLDLILDGLERARNA